jgi:hypothetical protein
MLSFTVQVKSPFRFTLQRYDDYILYFPCFTKSSRFPFLTFPQNLTLEIENFSSKIIEIEENLDSFPQKRHRLRKFLALFLKTRGKVIKKVDEPHRNPSTYFS